MRTPPRAPGVTAGKNSRSFATIFSLLVRLHEENGLLLKDQRDIQETPDAVAAAARRQRGRLLNFIRRRVREEADAEDILQDVFYQLLTSYSVTEPIEKLTAWLFTVARNKVVDWYRTRRLQSPLPAEGQEDGRLLLEEALFDPGNDTDRLHDRSLFWSELSDALDDMPEDQRDVFVWHELDGRTFKEIAEMTGEPINTLLSRKRYAIRFLRERLVAMEEELRE